MPADLQAVALGPQVIRVVDRPAREPEHLALELAQPVEAAAVHGNRVVHFSRKILAIIA